MTTNRGRTILGSIDFTEIPHSDQGFEFEHFAEHLLDALGWTIVQSAGKGPDGGRDIIAETTETRGTGGEVTRRYVVACKHHAHSGRSVSPRDVVNFHLTLRRDCTGWLLVTSSQPSSGLMEQIEAANEQNPQNHFGHWDSEDLEKRVRKDECREVLMQYFPRSYRKLHDLLAPSLDEVTDLCRSWAEKHDREHKLFVLDDEALRAIHATIVERGLSSREVTDLLDCESLSAEFLDSYCAGVVGKQTVGPVGGSLLFAGLRSIEEYGRKGLGEDSRKLLVAAHAVASLQFHAAARRQSRAILHEGLALDWETFYLSEENEFVPKLTTQAILRVYCPDQGGAATGLLKTPFLTKPIRLVTGYSIPQQIDPLSTDDLAKKPLEIQYRLDPGSDSVAFELVGVFVWA